MVTNQDRSRCSCLVCRRSRGPSLGRARPAPEGGRARRKSGSGSLGCEEGIWSSFKKGNSNVTKVGNNSIAIIKVTEIRKITNTHFWIFVTLRSKWNSDKGSSKLSRKTTIDHFESKIAAKRSFEREMYHMSVTQMEDEKARVYTCDRGSRHARRCSAGHVSNKRRKFWKCY